MTETIDLIRRFDIFSELPDKALDAVARLAIEQTHPEGTMIFSEDSSAENLFLLLDGKISLEKRVQLGSTGTPRRAPLSTIGGGQTLGWSSLVPPYKYTSTGICLEDATVLAIPGEKLREFMLNQPSVGFAISQRLASIIRGRMTSATATLTYFLSIVSHELKRPLAAVENYLQILVGGFAGELSAKQMRLLERSTLRLIDLRNLISDILDFARIQPEQIRADFETVDPAVIGSEAIEEVRLAATQKNIRLKASGPSEFQPFIAARRRLRQVISNLLANAIKFSPEGSTVTLSARDEPEALVIEVIDEGIGIPAEEQAHIFDDFYRASNVAEVSGAGLGLSIAKKIVDAHEGRIDIESPYDDEKPGTKFTIFLPRSSRLPGSHFRSNQNSQSKANKQEENDGSMNKERGDHE
jgi:signal transduction histidine kinase